MGNETGASGFYPMSSDPSELRRAIVEQARAQERNVLTFQQHMELRKIDAANMAALSGSIADLTIKVVEMRTKMAMYASIGAGAGGILTALVTHFLTK